MVHTEFWSGKLKWKYHLGDLSLEEKMTLKENFKKQDVGMSCIGVMQERDSVRQP